MASQSQSTRPRTYDLTLRAVLTFPLRMCNPPPAVAKVRSCGVTPLFKVRLDDVLNRQHLPPLGLKDFEEWLLFVEMSPENLYFTLWFREYLQRYNEWIAQVQLQRELNNGQEIHWHPQHSPSLALFYARAKQTFFTPNSPYELNLPSSLLAVFHTSTESPHPDPAIFKDVSIETYRLLDESLRRFVSAQFNNVGNNRVLCGIVAGAIFALAGFLPPIILNFTRPDSRWTRLLAFPGLFLGLTIMIAALNGVCMGVYIFGDLRQLRKFELARPHISRPQPIPEPKHEVESRSPSPASPPASPPDHEVSQVAKSPSFADARVAHLLRPSSFSSRSDESIAESGERPAIEISPAFFDDSSYVDVENGIISTSFTFPAVPPALNSPIGSDFTATASFIRPFDTNEIGPVDVVDDGRLSLDRLQPIGEFNFDSLPPRASRNKGKHLSGQYGRECCRDSLTLNPPSPLYVTYPSNPYPGVPYPAEPHSPSGFVERAQSRCDIKKWRLQTESQDHIPRSPPGELPVNPYNHHIVHRSYRSFSTNSTLDSTDTKVQKRFRLMNAVPAFAVPLTRVLSPVVRRGQWEIVVRSGLIALVVSWIIVGSLLAIPEIRR